MKPNTTTVALGLNKTKTHIADITVKAGRKVEEITLLAASKTNPPEALREAFAAGQVIFGENYLQEALIKIKALADLPIEWHFIGPIQSNKTKRIAENFVWVHSVDRKKIADRLSKDRPDSLPPLQICLQVNVSGEDSKSGVAPDQILDLASYIVKLPNLKIRGVMAIPELTKATALQRSQFSQVKQAFDQLKQAGYDVDTISMGMSEDFDIAIEEGATIVRVGTAIFGPRRYAIPEELAALSSKQSNPTKS